MLTRWPNRDFAKIVDRFFPKPTNSIKFMFEMKLTEICLLISHHILLSVVYGWLLLSSGEHLTTDLHASGLKQQGFPNIGKPT